MQQLQHPNIMPLLAHSRAMAPMDADQGVTTYYMLFPLFKVRQNPEPVLCVILVGCLSKMRPLNKASTHSSDCLSYDRMHEDKCHARSDFLCLLAYLLHDRSMVGKCSRRTVRCCHVCAGRLACRSVGAAAEG